MNIDKEILIQYIRDSEKIELNICESSVGSNYEIVHEGELNDFVYKPKTKTLELWVNTGYEI